MKFIQVFVIATGGLIVLALFSLFLMGRRPDAGRVTGMVEIDAPPAAVLPWLVEAPRLRKWVGWLADVKGDTTAAAVGRKQTWVMDDGTSSAVNLEVRLAAYAPPDSLRLELTVPGMVEGTSRYALEDLGGRTRLTVRSHYRHPNPAIALLEPLATPEAGAKLKADLARLRVQVESSGRDTTAAPADTAAAR